MLKKLAILLMTASAFAANATVLYEGSYELTNYRTAPLKVNASLLAGINSGDAITVNFSVGSAQTYGTIDICYGTTKAACNATKTNTKKDGNFATSATETSVTVTDENDLAGLKKSGLQLKGKNVTITKIVLGESSPVDPVDPDDPNPPTPPVDPDVTNIWSGETNTGKWANDVTVSADVFGPYKGGDKLVINLSVNSGAQYGTLELDDFDYNQLACDRTAAELDEYGCVQPGVTKLTYIITNSDMAMLKATGLRVKGADVTITAIGIAEGEPLPDDPVEEGKTTIWSGKINCGKWANTVSVAAEKFADAADSDALVLYLTKNSGARYGTVELQDQKGNVLSINGKGSNLDSEGKLVAGATNIAYTLEGQDLTLLKESGLLVKGMAVTITKIVLEKSTDGISELESDNDGTCIYFNLQGVQVENPTSGLYIMKCGKTIKKVLVK